MIRNHGLRCAFKIKCDHIGWCTMHHPRMGPTRIRPPDFKIKIANRDLDCLTDDLPSNLFVPPNFLLWSVRPPSSYAPVTQSLAISLNYFINLLNFLILYLYFEYMNISILYELFKVLWTIFRNIWYIYEIICILQVLAFIYENTTGEKHVIYAPVHLVLGHIASTLFKSCKKLKTSASTLKKLYSHSPM